MKLEKQRDYQRKYRQRMKEKIMMHITNENSTNNPINSINPNNEINDTAKSRNNLIITTISSSIDHDHCYFNNKRSSKLSFVFHSTHAISNGDIFQNVHNDGDLEGEQQNLRNISLVSENVSVGRNFVKHDHSYVQNSDEINIINNTNNDNILQYNVDSDIRSDHVYVLRNNKAQNIVKMNCNEPTEILEHYIGEMNVECVYCNAKHFSAERVANKGYSFNDCCN